MSNTTLFQRQNDYQAIRLLKAYDHCATRELIITYICVIFSVLFSVSGIILSSLKIVYAADTDIVSNLSTTQSIVSIVSGFYLIAQIFLLYFSDEFSKNKNTIMELYDNYTYDIKPNNMILRPISDAQIDEWSDRSNKRKNYQNRYFKSEQKSNSVFDNQVRIAYRFYGLLNFSFTRFYVYLWIGVIGIIAIFSIIIGFNAYFVDVLLSILIPSLSIITLVANSFRKYIIQKKAALSCINSIRTLKLNFEKDHKEPSTVDIRNLQDAIFQQRGGLMNFPNFIVKAYTKKEERKLSTKTEYITERKKKVEQQVTKEEKNIKETPDKNVDKPKVREVKKVVPKVKTIVKNSKSKNNTSKEKNNVKQQRKPQSKNNLNSNKR